MSGIVGIFHRDGRRADPEHVKQLTQRLAHRGPDGLTSWCAGEVGLGHVALHTTPEAVQERQPLTDARTKRTLVWDGRLDNRDELLAALAVRGAALTNPRRPRLKTPGRYCWHGCCKHRQALFQRER